MNIKILALGSTSLFMAACATTNFPLKAVASIPAAEGNVKAESARNDNTSIDLKVKHLAEPGKINAGATTFVVWSRATEQARAQNLGALRVDKDLKGELKTITPLRNFEVFITAEPSADVAEPSGTPLMSTRVSRK